MECYLDNAATTRAFPEVCELVKKVMYEDYGNPSSLHKKGVEGEYYLRQAAERVAKTLKCNPKNIIFTSGGTESNNMALLGTAAAKRRVGKHIITTCFEHPSVHEPLLYLENMGYEITYLPVDERGHVSTEVLCEALREDTILVSVMLVNNEVGAVLPVQELSETIKEYNPDIIFHVDAIQAYGKMRLQPKKLGIDLMSVSGHKFHGPKGIGFLYAAEQVKFHPYIHGGGQQRGMRSGTENVPGIAGLGLAAELMYEEHEEKKDRLYRLKEYFIQRIGEIEGAVVNACPSGEIFSTAPHIVSVSFAGVKSEVLLHALEEEGIYVSSGSACSSNHPGISGTLKAIGVPQEMLDSTLRFSFSVFTKKEELDKAVEALKKLVPVLARYTRR
ncbi:MAG: cysteine desulfurase [Lachnospiraceae bacterium]|nr:cysteine desulfurase [Lachnospiraceae bacterium]